MKDIPFIIYSLCFKIDGLICATFLILNSFYHRFHQTSKLLKVFFAIEVVHQLQTNIGSVRCEAALLSLVKSSPRFNCWLRCFY